MDVGSFLVDWKVILALVVAFGFYFLFYRSSGKRSASTSVQTGAGKEPVFSVDEALKQKENSFKPLRMEEIQKHNTKESLWLVIDKKVYDITVFAPEHPGQIEALLKWAGKDCTTAFYGDQHPDTVREMVGRYQIGFLQL